MSGEISTDNNSYSMLLRRVFFIEELSELLSVGVSPLIGTRPPSL
jgi:hypothetical protein